jgi:hypothetical protein
MLGEKGNGYPPWRDHSFHSKEDTMGIVVSTSYPYGNRTTEKKCTGMYIKNPTQCSNHVGGCFSEYYGEIFLHFYLE